jgi:hypothetical protein
VLRKHHLGKRALCSIHRSCRKARVGFPGAQQSLAGSSKNSALESVNQRASLARDGVSGAMTAEILELSECPKTM